MMKQTHLCIVFGNQYIYILTGVLFYLEVKTEIKKHKCHKWSLSNELQS